MAKAKREKKDLGIDWRYLLLCPECHGLTKYISRRNLFWDCQACGTVLLRPEKRGVWIRKGCCFLALPPRPRRSVLAWLRLLEDRVLKEGRKTKRGKA